METKELVTHIAAVETAEDMQRVEDLIRAQPGKMEPEVQTALLNKLRQITAQSRQAREETITVLRQNGVDYPLTDWLTPKNYAKQFGLKNPEVVLNWIKRGIVPEENIKEIPELGLHESKAVEYSPRNYERVAKALNRSVRRSGSIL